MNRRETPAVEWSERLGTPNGAQIAQILRHFHERPIFFAPPIDHFEATARPFLEALGVACRDITSLTLADIATKRQIVIARAFEDIIWNWGDLAARAEDYDDDGNDEGDLTGIIGSDCLKPKNQLLEMTETTNTILEARLLKPAFEDLMESFAPGASLPKNIASAAYSGFAATLIHLVVFLAIGDREDAETLGPWCAFYLNGNIPIGVDDKDTFLFLTR